MFRVPRNLVSGFLDLIRSDFNKPLALRKDLNRCFTAPAGSYPLGQMLLTLQDILGLHVRKDGIAAIGRIHPFIFTGKRGHLPLPVDSLSQCKIVLLPPVDVLFIAKGTDHDRTGTEGGVNCFVQHYRDFMTKQGHSHRLSFQMSIAFI